MFGGTCKIKTKSTSWEQEVDEDAYTHMYYRDWWNSLHESLKEPVKLQYELLVNKRISCRSVAPGLKKNWTDDLGVRQIDSDRELHTGSYKQMQDWLRGYNDVASRKIQTCWVPWFYFFFTQMWHNYISNVLLAQNDKGSLDIIKHLIVYLV